MRLVARGGTAEVGRGDSSSRFWQAVVAVAAIGTALRFWWLSTHDLIATGIVTDQRFYHSVANFLADGRGFVSPGLLEPTADKPPLYPLLLAAQSLIGLDSAQAHRLTGPLLGGATIVVLAALARRLGGDRVGLAAGLLVAADVQLWVLSSQILSETLYGLLLAVALLLGYRVHSHPTKPRALPLGMILGLAALTRPEAVVLGVLLALVLLRKHRKRALMPTLVAAVACGLVILPWAARNWITFDRPVFISQQSAENLAGANCRPTYYYAADIGSWRPDCLRPRLPGQNEAEWAASLRRDGIDYARDHASRVPVVVLARVARTWGFYPPSARAGFTDAEAWRESVIAWILLGLAITGTAVAVGRGVPVGILVVPAVTVTITAILQFGLLRYRFSADLAFLVLGAFAIDAAFSRLPAARAAAQHD